MATQTGTGYLVNFKLETTTGTAATGGAATGERLRTLASPGLALTRATVQSAEKRNDALMSMARLGGKSVAGSYNCELSQGSFDTLLEALMRSTWVAADAAITTDGGAEFTSFTVTDTSTITLQGTGSFITEGYRVGDILRGSDFATAANNDVNLHVKTVAANTLTFWGTPLTVQSADSAATLTIQKKLKTATTPTRRSFTVEQYLEDADQSENFLGCRVVSLSLAFGPDSMVTATFGFVGMDRTILATGSAPYFTSPTEYTSINLVADDATITYNGAVVTTLTGLTLDFTIAAAGQPTIGSLVSPDIFDNDMSVSATCTATIDDLDDLTAYDAETEFEMAFTLVEPDATAPVGFVHFFFPRVKYGAVTGALGSDGAYIQSRTLLIGPKVAATGYDAGICTISTG